MAHFGPQRHRGGEVKYKMLFLKYVPVETKISWLQPADDRVHSCTHLKCVNVGVCYGC
jgi:hypothetical protein